MSTASNIDAALLSASREMLAVVDPATLVIVDANPCFHETLGYSREAVVGHRITDFECALPDVFFWSEISAGLLGEEHHAEGLYSCANGDFLPVEKVIRRYDGRDGTLITISARDARSSIQTAEELQATSSTLQATFESVAEGIVVLDTAGELLNYNSRFIAIIGGGVVTEITHRRGQLRILRHLFRQTPKPQHALRQWRRLTTAEEEQTTHVFGFLDGRAIQCRGRPLMMNGQVEGRVLSVVDITERIVHERELAHARDAATASAKAKSDFLAMMSHEIRTPLTGILGMTELVLDAKIDARQREYLEMVLGSAKGLLTVINDVLDFSRIEAGRLLIEAIPFDLPATLREAAHPLKFQAAERGNHLALDIAVGDLPLLRGDPARIRQIVINLLGNAIKFTENGQITLAARGQTDTTTNSARLRLSVHDTGIGIAKEKLDLIFDAFTQSDVSISRRFGGTGLGLAISSQLVKAMAGTIRVESVLGKGSAFHIELVLPLAPADAAVMPTMGDDPATMIGPRGMNVLLVEDTRVNQVLIGALLKAAGHRVTLTNNGEEAVQAASLAPFDLVLMDIQMPIMDGFAATKILRESGLQTPIVALTAHATEGFREECLAKGMNGYLSKPIDRKAFQQMVKTYASNKALVVDDALPTEQVPLVVAQTVSVSSVQHFNIAAALDRLDGDTDLFATLIEGTIEQARHDIGELRGAVDARQSDAVRKIAHRLKGSLGAIGAEQAQETARLLELAGKEQRSGEFASLLGRLESNLALLEPILENYLQAPR